MGDKKKKPNNKPKPAPKNAAMIAKIKEMQELKRQEEEKIRLEEEKIRKEEEEELNTHVDEDRGEQLRRLVERRRRLMLRMSFLSMVVMGEVPA